jgi:hypothetical protein
MITTEQSERIFRLLKCPATGPEASASVCAERRWLCEFRGATAVRVDDRQEERWGAVKRTTQATECDLAALIKHGNHLRSDCAELSRTAGELMRTAARLKRDLAKQKRP